MQTAVFGLVRGHDNKYRYLKLIRRLRLLKSNLSGDYDVIIFHEGDISQEDRNILINEYSDIEFIDVGAESFKMPENISRSDIIDGAFDLGYRHMCQFRTIDQWDYLQQYDYIMQLDDDGWIESPIRYDIFDYCRKNNYKFCYIDRRGESHQKTVETLPEFTKNYIVKNKIDINCSLEDIHLEDAIINHIYITDVSFWQRENVQNYLEAIEGYGGIYKYRWGDSSIMSLAVKMFMNREYIHEMDEFNYTHGNHDYANYRKQWILNNIQRVPFISRGRLRGLSLCENVYWRYWQFKQYVRDQ
jgi:hypothetical protein